MRSCGDCQLCCKLLPVREIAKLANTRCQHQKRGKGCGVYHTKAMPPSCKLWSCRWLVTDRTQSLRRPDRAGYVVDIMPDYVTIRNDLDGSFQHVAVIQIWVDPARPNLWRYDYDLLAYLDHMGREENLRALIRNGSNDAIFVSPPSLNPDGTWFIHESGVSGPAHTPVDYAKAGFAMTMHLEER